MTTEIKEELLRAKKLYRSKEYGESFDIYEKIYSKNSEEFKQSDKFFYSWAIYRVHVKDEEDENQLFESTELITELVSQADLTKKSACAYTFSVFKVLDYLYKHGEYEHLLYWLDKLDPSLLDAKQSEFHGRFYPSRREKYYSYSSKAYFECKDYENCILISDKGLRSFHRFTYDNDVWFNWRIAKSLKELGESEKALTYLNEVSKSKNDWFISKEIAENYFILGDEENAIKYVGDAISTDEPARIKVNLYYLAYKVLKDDEPEIALKHAELVAPIKLENNVALPEDIEDLQINENDLDANKLEREIKDYWSKNKFKDQRLQYGKVTRIHDHGKSGFITSPDNERFYFRIREFKDDISLLREGLSVTFYTQMGFDKSKNQESINAVNIHADNI